MRKGTVWVHLPGLLEVHSRSLDQPQKKNVTIYVYVVTELANGITKLPWTEDRCSVRWPAKKRER